MSSRVKSSRAASNSTTSTSSTTLKNGTKKSDQTEVKHGRQPTADQLRIAQLTDNTSSTETSHLNALIEQV